MRMRVSLCAAACALVVVSGCGGGDDDSGGGQSKAASSAEADTVTTRASDFPEANGRTLAQIGKGIATGDANLAPALSQLEPGRARFGFALFTKSYSQITGVPVALYVAPKGGGKAQGPFAANSESLTVKPQYRSQNVASDPDAAKSLYVTHLPFARAGSYDVLAIAKTRGGLVRASAPPGLLKVTATSNVPDVGDKAPSIDTPTATEVGGDLKKIDTRLPPSSLHAANVKDVLGKKPLVLIFATPALCQSRVCGPVVDIAEEVKDERGKEADFVQQEIYRDNKIKNGFRPQVRAYNLPTEPWVFAIDRKGKVAARLEGAFTAAELNAAVDKAVKG